MKRSLNYILSPSEFLQELRGRGISDSTLRSASEKWFINTYVKRNTKPFEQDSFGAVLQVGKIYSFDYSDPKYKEELDFYSALPIMLCIGHRKTKDGKVNPIGINLTFMPPKIRLAYLDIVWKKFDTLIIRGNIRKLMEGKDGRQRLLPLFYSVNKMIARNLGWEFAIRSYIPSRIKTEPEIITYTDWWKLCVFTNKFLEKKNIQEVYYLYKKAMNPDYKTGKKEKPVKVETITIKELKERLKGNR